MQKNKDEYTTDEGPPPSDTRDRFSHHSSPQDDVQQAIHQPPAASTPGRREVTGTVSRKEVPMHVVKHPDPVGRPKNRNYD